MTPTETTTILRRFNEWRRGGDIEQPGPLAVDEAIDAAVEMIDRLEAAERSDAESIAMYRKARDERDELRAKIETAENDAAHQKALAASALRVAEGWEGKCNSLRAKIEAMERQEPVGEIQRANSTGNYICSEVWVPLPVGSKLYALPGALPAPSVPDGWKLVPIEPTPEMKTAGIGVEVYQASPPSTDSLTWEEAAAIYAAMISATPEAKP